jgi:hypothetical protein
MSVKINSTLLRRTIHLHLIYRMTPVSWSTIPWSRKLTTAEKDVRALEYNRKRMLRNPTRTELRDGSGATEYCKIRGLSDVASRCVTALVLGAPILFDWRDQRQLPKRDRVPRSLYADRDTTPPRYWDVTDPVYAHIDSSV